MTTLLLLKPVTTPTPSPSCLSHQVCFTRVVSSFLLHIANLYCLTWSVARGMTKTAIQKTTEKEKAKGEMAYHLS